MNLQHLDGEHRSIHVVLDREGLRIRLHDDVIYRGETYQVTGSNDDGTINVKGNKP